MCSCKRRLKRVITLDELRAHAASELAGMIVLRAGNRLSVMPVEEAHGDSFSRSSDVRRIELQ